MEIVAGEDIKKGDMVYLDPISGTLKKSNLNKPKEKKYIAGEDLTGPYAYFTGGSCFLYNKKED